MITNFEEVSRELSDEEEKILIPILVNGFKSHSKKDPVKAPDIVRKINLYLKKKEYKIKMTEVRLRKCCNYIRSNSLIPLIATSAGYYVSYEPAEIEAQITSLRERANSINRCAEGMADFLPHYSINSH